ncbi:MAG: YggS family pyridoxal phosphate-dependent enzyme [Desulfovibrio sp.]|jgi:pyridoxal phosphate enzyme (YggS family)|nr:YggS family pyridoxal phosphate-dependent enzyme [Desulfovibrio sp.]
MSALQDRFDAIGLRITEALARSGRERGAARLVAVSKWHPAESLAELARHWAATTGFGPGPLFGESYMQEARDKMPRVSALLADSPIIPGWHFVGHVQSKKAKDIVGRFSLIHSVDSLKLAAALDRAWQSRVEDGPRGPDDAGAAPQAVLVQVNVGREAQKSGVDPEEAEALIDGIAAMPGLRLRGLMCLPPLQEIGRGSRPYFVMLREFRDGLEKRLGLPLPELSMGMSDDFEAAIEEGATLVRIGTDIFGPRE